MEGFWPPLFRLLRWSKMRPRWSRLFIARAPKLHVRGTVTDKIDQMFGTFGQSAWLLTGQQWLCSDIIGRVQYASWLSESLWIMWLGSLAIKIWCHLYRGLTWSIMSLPLTNTAIQLSALVMSILGLVKLFTMFLHALFHILTLIPGGFAPLCVHIPPQHWSTLDSFSTSFWSSSRGLSGTWGGQNKYTG
jgi:hypothetical protein